MFTVNRLMIMMLYSDVNNNDTCLHLHPESALVHGTEYRRRKPLFWDDSGFADADTIFREGMYAMRYHAYEMMEREKVLCGGGYIFFRIWNSKAMGIKIRVQCNMTSGKNQALCETPNKLLKVLPAVSEWIFSGYLWEWMHSHPPSSLLTSFIPHPLLPPLPPPH